jgi:hypothetical protein
MGMIKCKVHGFSGIALVCPHIEKMVRDGEEVRDFTDIRIDIENADFVVTYTFCSDCAVKFQLPHTPAVLDGSASDKFKAALETTQPVCGSCLVNLKVRGQ